MTRDEAIEMLRAARRVLIDHFKATGVSAVEDAIAAIDFTTHRRRARIDEFVWSRNEWMKHASEEHAKNYFPVQYNLNRLIVDILESQPQP